MTPLAARELNVVRYDQSTLDEAETLARKALSAAEAAYGTDSPEVLSALDSLASIYLHSRRYELAERQLRRALNIAEKVDGADSIHVAEALVNLGSALAVQEQYAAAEGLYRRGLAIRRKAGGDDSVMALETLSGLGWVLARQGRYRDAYENYWQVREGRRRALGEDAPSVISATASIAEVRYALGDRKEAETLFSGALAALERQPGDLGLGYLDIRANLAKLAEDRGEYGTALAERRVIQTAYEGLFGARDDSVARGLTAIGDNLFATGDLGSAEGAYRLALDIQREHMRPDSLAVTGVEAKFAWSMMERGNYAAAEPALRRVVAATEKVFGPDHRFVAERLRGVAASLCAQGRLAECKSFLQRADVIAAAHPADGFVSSSWESEKLGDQKLAAKRLSEARAAYKDALNLMLESPLNGPLDSRRIGELLEKVAVTYDRERKAPLAAFYRTWASMAPAK